MCRSSTALCKRKDIDLNVLIVGQSDRQRDGEDRHERMLQKGEFDVAELSLSSYLMAKSRGMPFTAIPVFPRRLFSHSQMWINVDAGINEPKDLVGKKVGLHSFQNTLATLSKGDLQSEFDVPWRKIHWLLSKKDNIEFEPEKGVKIDQLSDDANAGDMLEKGEISAMMTPHPPKPVLRGSKKIKRLFADPKAEDLRYYKKNGFFPIMHVVAFKDDVLKKYPEAAQSLFNAFTKRKKSAASSTPTRTGPGSPGAVRLLRKKKNSWDLILGRTGLRITARTWKDSSDTRWIRG